MIGTRIPGGVVCGSAPRRRRCSVCRQLVAGFECDYPDPSRKSGTCDAMLCEGCRCRYDDKDFCPTHIMTGDQHMNVRPAMKALTLRDPWATLVAIGAKKYETRDWQPPPGTKTIALHSSKVFKDDENQLCKTEPFRTCLVESGRWPPGLLVRQHVLALVDVVGCFRTEDVRGELSEQERAFGNYDDNRFAWQLDNLRVLRRPVPAKGMQKLWWVEFVIEEQIRRELPPG